MSRRAFSVCVPTLPLVLVRSALSVLVTEMGMGGNMAEHHEGSGHAEVRAHASAQATVQRYHRLLLERARAFVGDNTPQGNQMAVVIAQMAAEICVERAMDAVLQKKGLQYLRDSLFPASASFNLGADRVYRPYKALTGDNLRQAAWWEAFRKHVERRNDAVHSGAPVSQAEALASIEAATELVAQVERTVPEVGP